MKGFLQNGCGRESGMSQRMVTPIELLFKLVLLRKLEATLFTIEEPMPSYLPAYVFVATKVHKLQLKTAIP